MNELLHDPANGWVLAGALIIAFEAFTAPGLGIFLGGLGAICAGLLIKSGLIEPASLGAQLASCFTATVLWTLLLWKPLQHFRVRMKSRGPELKANNLLGEIATVGKLGLKPGETGQVIWSGTVMNAKLDASAAPLPEGAHVVIHAVNGNTLNVAPK